jgi:hypothetical protein
MLLALFCLMFLKWILQVIVVVLGGGNWAEEAQVMPMLLAFAYHPCLTCLYQIHTVHTLKVRLAASKVASGFKKNVCLYQKHQATYLFLWP